MALLFSSLVLLSSTRTFLLTRVQHCQPLSQSKFIPSEYCIRIMRESYACGLKTSISVADLGEGPEGPEGLEGPAPPTPPRLFLDQTEAPHYLRVWMTTPPSSPIWRSESATGSIYRSPTIFLCFRSFPTVVVVVVFYFFSNINILFYLCLRIYSKRVWFYIFFLAAQNSTAKTTELHEIFAGSSFCDFSIDPEKKVSLNKKLPFFSPQKFTPL